MAMVNGGKPPATLCRVLLKLYYIWTAAVLRALGARRIRLAVGETVLLASEIGPPDAEPWVLLHGLGSTSLAWSRVLRTLRGEVRFLVPELSALGGTVTPGGGLNVADGVKALEALIDWWAPKRPVTLAGISLGGWMAVRLTLARPDLVGRLILIDAGGYRDQDWDRIQELTDVSTLAHVKRLYQALFHRTPFVLAMSRHGFLQAYSSRAVKSILESTTPEHAYGPEDLATIDKPTLIIWGEHDGLFRIEVGRAMRDHLPQARLVTLSDAGHAVHWEKPQEMTEAINGFRLDILPPQ